MSNTLATINDTEIVKKHPEERARDIINSLDISEATRQDYLYRIPEFIAFIKKHGISFNTFLEYKRLLHKRTDIKISTKNKYLQSARIFLKELHRQGLLPVDLTANIHGWTQDKKHKKDGFNEKEIKSIVEKLNNLPETKKNIRLKAIFALLTFQGLRQIEITRLDVEDIDLQAHTALIQGKGKSDKELIYLHPETVQALQRHIKGNKVGSGALFKGLGNRKSERITTMTVKREIQPLLTQLNITKSVHGFRHFFITSLLQKLDVRDVRKFSRHSNLEMLIVYDDELDTKHKADEAFTCFQGLHLSV